MKAKSLPRLHTPAPFKGPKIWPFWSAANFPVSLQCVFPGIHVFLVVFFSRLIQLPIWIRQCTHMEWFQVMDKILPQLLLTKIETPQQHQNLFTLRATAGFCRGFLPLTLWFFDFAIGLVTYARKSLLVNLAMRIQWPLIFEASRHGPCEADLHSLTNRSRPGGHPTLWFKQANLKRRQFCLTWNAI